MSKTHPKAGTLRKRVVVTINSQESAYRTLLSVPFLTARDRRALMRAIVDGPELCWIRLAFNKGLMPSKSAEKRHSIERFLAGSGTENALAVLRGSKLRRFRARAIARLADSPRSAYRVIKAQYVSLSKGEFNRLLDIIVPTVTSNQAAKLLTQHIHGDGPIETTVGRRLKLVQALKGYRFAESTAAQLLGERCSIEEWELHPPLTPKERSILIELATQESCWAEMLLYPSRGSFDAQLTEEEKKLVVPRAFAHLMEQIGYKHPARAYIDNAQHYLQHYASLLTAEQNKQLTEAVQLATAKAA